MTAAEPFTAFDFRVEILPAGAAEPLCDAAFAECEGLELRIDVRAFREGGDNARERLLAGPASYGEVTLKRGMTESFDLWDWCDAVLHDPTTRADARVIMLAADGTTEQARFRLERCLPTRLRAPRLDARDGIVAIEELQLACESVRLEGPKTQPAARAMAELRAGGDRIPLEANPAKLHLSHGEESTTLAFDLTLEAQPGHDVRELTSRLARRPEATFAWGAFRFDGRVAALEEELDLFAPDGRALRATVGVTMLGRADPGSRTRTSRR